MDYMKRDGKLSDLLHVLLHMAELDGPVTSEALAGILRTHPVVIRRTMAGLRDAGFVQSAKGHGGGWTLVRSLESITLRDVYIALGEPSLFAIGHRSEGPTCLIEQAVNAALDKELAEAHRLLMDRFGAITLGALSAEFHHRLVAQGVCINQVTTHAA
jgi:DNA-binding IscR family transcriptional regulator